MKHRITLQPSGRRIDVEPGIDLLTAAQRAGVDLIASCSGVGICGTCRVRLINGEVTPPTRNETDHLTPADIAGGYRLACQAQPRGDLCLEVPPGSLSAGQRLQVDGQGVEVARDPVLKASAPQLGLAVDIGTTKLAMYLVDLVTGITLAQGGRMNPQIAFGEDVISRIAFANRDPGNRGLLQSRLVDALNEMAADLCSRAGMKAEHIVDAVAVGNTVMHHLFAGLPVEQLGAAPYVPAVSAPLTLQAAEVGLRLAPGAQVYLPANIAGYVGADHTAVLAATRIDAEPQASLVIDIGTNTEVSLAVGGRLYSCSCASGPAFEGAHIQDGMRAAAGAVDGLHITVTGDGIEVQVNTIDGAPAVGICGSGILQAVAELRAAGIVDERGALIVGKPRVRGRGKGAGFLLVPAQHTGHGRDIVITRRDVHEVQLAKAAIRAGIEILLSEAGIPAEAVGQWLLAGAFGTYIDVPSALRIGMFPPQAAPGRFRQVGNAAGQGARLMLLSRPLRTLSAELAARSHYVDLTTQPGFMEVYVGALGM
jgi:uncharacterized 2Fe-2S/4Fe-4S cluster protein (DUF4445 family)